MIGDLLRLVKNMAGFTGSEHIMPYPIELAEPMASSFPGLVIVMDTKKDRILWMSPGALLFANITASTAKQLSARAFIQSYFQPAEPILELMEKHPPHAEFSSWFKKESDSRFVIGICSCIDKPSEEPHRLMMVFSDATEIENSRQALLQYAEELRQQSESIEALMQDKEYLLKDLETKNKQLHLMLSIAMESSVAQLILDEEKKILWCNEAAANLMNTYPQALYGKPLNHLPEHITRFLKVHETKAEPETVFLETLLENAPISLEVYQRGTGQSPPSWYLLHINPVVYEGSAYYIVSLSDITEIKHKEAQLKAYTKEIEDSLRYGQRIFSGFLPNPSRLRHHFSDAEIWFAPKKGIGGDFYYFEEVEEGILLVLGDSCGHGVPAALLSIYALTELRGALAKCRNSVACLYAYFLEKLHENIKEDGIPLSSFEMALLWIDWQKGTMDYMGVRRPLWVARGETLYEISPLKEHLSPYTTSTPELYTLAWHKGERLFLFSDGATDQLNPYGKKFSPHRLREIIKHHHDKPLSTLFAELKAQLSAWTGEEEQTDDILVIGIEL